MYPQIGAICADVFSFPVQIRLRCVACGAVPVIPVRTRRPSVGVLPVLHAFTIYGSRRLEQDKNLTLQEV